MSYQFTKGDLGRIGCSTYGINLNNYWTFRRDGETHEHRIELDATYKYLINVDGSLIIFNIDNGDIGEYKCVSKNPFGTITSQTKVDVVIG